MAPRSDSLLFEPFFRTIGDPYEPHIFPAIPGPFHFDRLMRGDWRIGDRRLAPALSRYFTRRGFAMASINYRLSGEATFPAQLHNHNDFGRGPSRPVIARSAQRWLRARNRWPAADL